VIVPAVSASSEIAKAQLQIAFFKDQAGALVEPEIHTHLALIKRLYLF